MLSDDRQPAAAEFVDEQLQDGGRISAGKLERSRTLDLALPLQRSCPVAIARL